MYLNSLLSHLDCSALDGWQESGLANVTVLPLCPAAAFAKLSWSGEDGGSSGKMCLGMGGVDDSGAEGSVDPPTRPPPGGGGGGMGPR